MKLKIIQIIGIIIIIIGVISLIGVITIEVLYNNYTGRYPKTQWPDTIDPDNEYSITTPNIVLPIDLMIITSINSSNTPNCSVILNELNTGMSAVVLTFNQGNGSMSKACADCLGTYGFERTGKFNIIIRNDGATSIELDNVMVLILENEILIAPFNDILLFIPLLIILLGTILFTYPMKSKRKLKIIQMEDIHLEV